MLGAEDQCPVATAHLMWLEQINLAGAIQTLFTGSRISVLYSFCHKIAEVFFVWF